MTLAVRRRFRSREQFDAQQQALGRARPALQLHGRPILAVMAGGGLRFDRKVRPDVDAGGDRIIVLRDRAQIDVVIAAELRGVAPDQWHQPQRKFQPALGKSRPVQLLRTVRRAGFGVTRRVAGRMKGLGRLVVDEDVIGMAVAAKGIEGDEDIAWRKGFLRMIGYKLS